MRPGPWSHELRNKIGEEACGAKRSLGGAESPSGVALEICTHFVSERTNLLNGNLSDIIVAEEYVSLFADMASSILDTSTLIQANATFVKEMMFDVRRPWYPTRATGLLPNCIGCRDGNFQDMNTQRMVPLSDHRYASMNVFRLIGYVLHLAGYNCPALYNPGDTSPSNYGPYKDSVCG